MTRRLHDPDPCTWSSSIYADGSVNSDWDPEFGNYSGLFTQFVEGVLGLEPTERRLLIRPTRLAGMTLLEMKPPLHCAGKDLHLKTVGSTRGTLKRKWTENGETNW